MENIAYSEICPPDPQPEVSLQSLSKSEMGCVGLLFSLAVGLAPTPAQAMLETSDRCSAVSDLQNALWDYGFDPGPVDGHFGNQTRQAVLDAQQNLGLTVDGIVGAQTARALGLDPQINCSQGDAAPFEAQQVIETQQVSAWSSNAWVKTLGSSLNVRSAPNSEASVIDELPYGSAVSLDAAVVGEWTQLQGGGWVATRFLSFEPPDSAPSNSYNDYDTADIYTEAAWGEVTYNVLPGWTLADIAAHLEMRGLFSARDFLDATRNIPYGKFSWLPSGLYDLEGFLYPSTYSISADATPYEVIDQMLLQFEITALPVYEDAGSILDLKSWVTLASIVELEAAVNWEKPQIAGVFLNRLYAGMRLEADPTVEYALGIQQTPEAPLTWSEVSTPSPYNTYMNVGLPPGAIGSPDLASLEAVLSPAATNDLFFVACFDGTHEFNETFEEHQDDIDTTCGASRGYS